MAYDNTNKGTLGKNKRREKDTHPEYTGQINIDGKDYWLSAWVKQGNNNEKFFSLAVKPKEQQSRDNGNYNKKPNENRSGAQQDYDSDIPFAPIGKHVQ